MRDIYERIANMGDAAYVPALQIGKGIDFSETYHPEAEPVCTQHALYWRLLLKNYEGIDSQVVRAHLPPLPDVFGPGSPHDHLVVEAEGEQLQACGTYQQFLPEQLRADAPRSVIAPIGNMQLRLAEIGVPEELLYLWDLANCRPIERTKFATT